MTDESPLAILGRQDESYLKKERGLSPVKPRLWIIRGAQLGSDASSSIGSHGCRAAVVYFFATW
jgi:hypothetical protein